MWTSLIPLDVGVTFFEMDSTEDNAILISAASIPLAKSM